MIIRGTTREELDKALELVNVKDNKEEAASRVNYLNGGNIAKR